MTPIVYIVNDTEDRACAAELRKDGWPICPFCDEDELASLEVPATVETISLCHVCGPVRAVVA